MAAAQRIVAMPTQDSGRGQMIAGRMTTTYVTQVASGGGMVMQLLLVVRGGQRVVIQGRLLLVVVRRIAAERHGVDEHDGWLFVERGGG